MADDAPQSSEDLKARAALLKEKSRYEMEKIHQLELEARAAAEEAAKLEQLEAEMIAKDLKEKEEARIMELEVKMREEHARALQELEERNQMETVDQLLQMQESEETKRKELESRMRAEEDQRLGAMEDLLQAEKSQRLEQQSMVEELAVSIKAEAESRERAEEIARKQQELAEKALLAQEEAMLELQETKASLEQLRLEEERNLKALENNLRVEEESRLAQLANESQMATADAIMALKENEDQRMEELIRKLRDEEESKLKAMETKLEEEKAQREAQAEAMSRMEASIEAERQERIKATEDMRMQQAEETKAREAAAAIAKAEAEERAKAQAEFMAAAEAEAERLRTEGAERIAELEEKMKKQQEETIAAMAEQIREEEQKRLREVEEKLRKEEEERVAEYARQQNEEMDRRAKLEEDRRKKVMEEEMATQMAITEELKVLERARSSIDETSQLALMREQSIKWERSENQKWEEEQRLLSARHHEIEGEKQNDALRRLADRVVAKGSTGLDQFTATLRRMDKTKEDAEIMPPGYLSIDDFVKAVRIFDRGVSADDATLVFELHDPDHSGAVDLETVVKGVDAVAGGEIAALPPDAPDKSDLVPDFAANSALSVSGAEAGANLPTVSEGVAEPALAKPSATENVVAEPVAAADSADADADSEPDDDEDENDEVDSGDEGDETIDNVAAGIQVIVEKPPVIIDSSVVVPVDSAAAWAACGDFNEFGYAGVAYETSSSINVPGAKRTLTGLAMPMVEELVSVSVETSTLVWRVVEPATAGLPVSSQESKLTVKDDPTKAGSCTVAINIEASYSGEDEDMAGYVESMEQLLKAWLGGLAKQLTPEVPPSPRTLRRHRLDQWVIVDAEEGAPKAFWADPGQRSSYIEASKADVATNAIIKAAAAMDAEQPLVDINSPPAATSKVVLARMVKQLDALPAALKTAVASEVTRNVSAQIAGTVTVTVLQAKRLKGARLDASDDELPPSSVRVIVEADGRRAQTPAVRGSAAPFWIDGNELNLPVRAADSIIKLTVAYTDEGSNENTTTTPAGSVEWSTADVEKLCTEAGGDAEDWFPLEQDLNPAGVIYVRLSFASAESFRGFSDEAGQRSLDDRVRGGLQKLMKVVRGVSSGADTTLIEQLQLVNELQAKQTRLVQRLEDVKLAYNETVAASDRIGTRFVRSVATTIDSAPEDLLGVQPSRRVVVTIGAAEFVSGYVAPKGGTLFGYRLEIGLGNAVLDTGVAVDRLKPSWNLTGQLPLPETGSWILSVRMLAPKSPEDDAESSMVASSSEQVSVGDARSGVSRSVDLHMTSPMGVVVCNLSLSIRVYATEDRSIPPGTMLWSNRHRLQNLIDDLSEALKAGAEETANERLKLAQVHDRFLQSLSVACGMEEEGNSEDDGDEGDDDLEYSGAALDGITTGVKNMQQSVAGTLARSMALLKVMASGVSQGVDAARPEVEQAGVFSPAVQEESHRQFMDVMKGREGESRKRLLRAFKLVDVDKSGSLDLAEFRRAIALFHVGLDDEAVRALFAKYDADSSGDITYDEIMAVVDDEMGVVDENDPAYVAEATQSALQRFAREVIRRDGHELGGLQNSFIAMDTDGNGTLDLDEFTVALRLYNQAFTTRDAQLMFKKFDADESGDVTYEELLVELKRAISDLDDQTAIDAARLAKAHDSFAKNADMGSPEEQLSTVEFVLDMVRSYRSSDLLHGPVLDDLVRATGNSDYPKLQAEAAEAATAIVRARGNAAAVRVCANDALLSSVRTLLGSPVGYVLEQGADLVAALALPATHKALIDAGIVAALVPSLHPIHHSALPPYTINEDFAKAQLGAAKAVAKLMWIYDETDSTPAYDKLNSTVPHIAKGIEATEDAVVEDCLWCLVLLAAAGNTSQIELILRHARPEVIVPLLEHTKIDVRAPALRLIGNCLTANEKIVRHLIEVGVLHSLAHIVTHDRTDLRTAALRKEAAWALSNCAAGGPTNVRALIRAELIPSLVDLTMDSDDRVSSESTWALANCALAGDDAQLSFLNHAHATQAFIDIVTTGNARMATVGMEALLSLVRAGARHQEEQGLASNPYGFELRLPSDGDNHFVWIEEMKGKHGDKMDKLCDQMLSILRTRDESGVDVNLFAGEEARIHDAAARHDEAFYIKNVFIETNQARSGTYSELLEAPEVKESVTSIAAVVHEACVVASLAADSAATTKLRNETQFANFAPDGGSMHLQIRSVIDVPWKALKGIPDKFDAHVLVRVDGVDYNTPAVGVHVGDFRLTFNAELDVELFDRRCATVMCWVIASDADKNMTLIGKSYIPVHDLGHEWQNTEHSLIQDDFKYERFGTLQVSSKILPPSAEQVSVARTDASSHSMKAAALRDAYEKKVASLEALIQGVTFDDAKQKDRMVSLAVEAKKARFLLRKNRERVSELQSEIAAKRS